MTEEDMAWWKWGLKELRGKGQTMYLLGRPIQELVDEIDKLRAASNPLPYVVTWWSATMCRECHMEVLAYTAADAVTQANLHLDRYVTGVRPGHLSGTEKP